jgi:hypothetical protein
MGKVLQTDIKASPSNYGGPVCDLQGRVIGILVPVTGNSATAAPPMLPIMPLPKIVPKKEEPKKEEGKKDPEKPEGTKPEGVKPEDKKPEGGLLPVPPGQGDKPGAEPGKEGDKPQTPPDQAEQTPPEKPDLTEVQKQRRDELKKLYPGPTEEPAKPEKKPADKNNKKPQGDKPAPEKPAPDKPKDGAEKPKTPTVPPAPNGMDALGLYDTGIAFIAPMEDILRNLPRMKESKAVEAGAVGVNLKRDEKITGGAQVDVVLPESPAEKGGIKKDDLIVEAAGEKVEQFRHLMHILGRFNAGDKVPLVVKRGDQTINMTVELISRKDLKPAPAPVIIPPATDNPKDKDKTEPEKKDPSKNGDKNPPDDPKEDSPLPKKIIIPVPLPQEQG